MPSFPSMFFNEKIYIPTVVNALLHKSFSDSYQSRYVQLNQELTVPRISLLLLSILTLSISLLKMSKHRHNLSLYY